jgi:NADPH:quinone reductase-like Zn-dependent oxidoreductase
MSGQMRALTLGADGRMVVVPADRPAPGRGQVLVEIRASAVNEMDVQVRAGGWPSQVRRFRRAGLQRLIDLAVAGTLKPAIDSVLRLDEADAAFDRFATRGK